MSIDPRAMKTMLLHYMTPNISYLTGSPTDQASSASTNAASLFQAMLGSYAGNTGSLAISGQSPVYNPQLMSVLPAAQHSSLLTESAGFAGAVQAVNKGTAYDQLINEAAEVYHIDAALIHAVIQIESNYNNSTVSHAGAKGLMQLMDGTAKGLGVTDSFDARQNIFGGTKYLSMLLRKYNGEAALALAAYNGGPGRMDRLGIHTLEHLQEKKQLLPKETQRYIEKVMNAWQ